MHVFKRLKFLFVILSASLCLSVPWAFADEKKDEKKEVTKEEKIAKIKDIQEQQKQVRVDYEKKKNDLDLKLREVLKDYKEETGKPTIQNLIKDNNQEQEKLRDSFKEQLRKLQVEERKIRLGRESLERPSVGRLQKQGEVYNQALDEKQQRLDFQKRKEAQDKLFRREREEEREVRSFTPPAAWPPSSPSPAQPTPKIAPGPRVTY